MVLDEPGAPRALRQHCLEVGVPGQEQGRRREVLTERIPLRQVMAVPILLWTGQGPSASDEDRAVQASVVFRCEHPASIQHLGVCRKLWAGAKASTLQFLVAEQRTGQACRTGRVIFLGEEFIDRVAAVGGGGVKQVHREPRWVGGWSFGDGATKTYHERAVGRQLRIRCQR